MITAPSFTSEIVNDACWTFLRAIPCNVNPAIFNNLKPALYAVLLEYHSKVVDHAELATTYRELARFHQYYGNLGMDVENAIFHQERSAYMYKIARLMLGIVDA